MANNIPFQAMGPTVACTVTGAANTQSAVFTITATSPCQQYYIANGDNNFAVYIAISSASNLTAQLPETTPNYVITLPPYAYKVITGPQVSQSSNVYARIIGDGANASCYITPGEGF
jgi:hypothetical protein